MMGVVLREFLDIGIGRGEENRFLEVCLEFFFLALVSSNLDIVKGW